MTSGATCIEEDATLADAAKRLAKEDIGSMPICGTDQRLKGVLTDRDIVVKAIAKGKDVTKTLVSELAQGKPVTIGADDSTDEALKTMERHQVRRLPVIDGHTLVGIVSQADIARSLKKKDSGKLLEQISEPHGYGVRRTIRMSKLVTMLGIGVGIAYLVRQRGRGVAHVGASTQVHVPVRDAYDQWTQFEEFPRFMGGVDEVRQLDDTHLRWVGNVGGRHHQWQARITQQEPDRVVAWQATEGKHNAGRVSFRPIDAQTTEVTVEMEYEPEGLSEELGSALGLAKRRVQGDLDRFKDLIESRGTPTGAWRGTVQAGTTTSGS
jgi:uncharacterized membrane protein/predicted transcriptional regulator